MNTIDCNTVARTHSNVTSSHLRPRGAWIPKIVTRIRHGMQVARERRQLAALADHELKDIGLSRVDAMQEYERPFWDLPPRR